MSQYWINIHHVHAERREWLLIFCLVLFCFAVTGSHYVAQTALELAILLPQPPKCWDYRCVAPYPVGHLWKVTMATHTESPSCFPMHYWTLSHELWLVDLICKAWILSRHPHGVGRRRQGCRHHSPSWKIGPYLPYHPRSLYFSSTNLQSMESS
jgi:hypothetical protein